MIVKTNYSPTRLKRNGFSLVEISIVMGVMGLLLAGIWTLLQVGGEQSKENQAQLQLKAIAGAMSSVLQSGYSSANGTDITATMITRGVIPGPLQSSPTTATHPWGGNFVLTWLSSIPRKYRASFFGVTKQQGCVSLLMKGTAYCLLSDPGCPIAVQTAAGSVVGSTLSLYGNAMTFTQAQTLCNFNVYPGTSANNSVEFDFIN
jgi:prepilin-type N-terminal cleavage/methylation domain-containing protein